MEEPGSLDGSINSPIPHLGPEDKSLISFQILYDATINEFIAPDKLTIES